MTAITISRNAETALQIAQWIRNGKSPSAEIQNRLSTLVGYAANVRTKLVFHSTGGLVGTAEASLIPNSLATRSRWRFAWHASPFAWFLYAEFQIAPQNNGSATDPYCTLDVANTSGTVIGRATMHGGSSGGSYADVPLNFTGGIAVLLDPTTPDPTTYITLTPDTEYTGVFKDVGYARLHSAAVWEVALAPDTDNGYVPNTYAVGGPIFDADRYDAVHMARLLHKRSGTPVLGWCSDLDSSAPTYAPAGGTGTADAAMTLGAITVSATGGAGGVGDLASTLGAITVSSTGSLATLTVTPTGGSVAHGGSTLTVTVAVVANIAQTNGQFSVRIGWLDTTADGGTIANCIASVANADIQGWSVASAWAITTESPPQSYITTLTKAAVAATTYTFQFTVTSGANANSPTTAPIRMTTNYGTVAGVLGTSSAGGNSALTTEATAPDSTPATITVT